MKLSGNLTVPEGWQCLPLKRITRFGYGDTLASDERERHGIKVYGSNGPFDEHSEANTLAPCIIVGRKGSYGKLNFSYDSVFAIDTTFVIDQRHTCADLRFLYYSLGTLGLDELSDDIAVPGLSREKAYQALCLLPPLKTQQQIARFLDDKTAHIDGLIKKKRELLKCLAEKRQALITHAVTKGIDSNTPMKSSGIDLVSDDSAELKKQIGTEEKTIYRKGWSEVKLRDVAEINNGKSNSQDADSTGIYPLFDRSMLIKKSNRYLFDKEAVIVPGEGQEFIPKYHYGKFDLHQRCYAIHSFNKSIFPKFCYYYLVNSNNYFRSVAVGSTVSSLRLGHFQKLPVILPPFKIQRQIAQFLDENIAQIDQAVEKIEDSITQMEEYRSALITAAVTGQLSELQ